MNQNCFNCKHEPQWRSYTGKNRRIIGKTGKCEKLGFVLTKKQATSLENEQEFLTKHNINLVPQNNSCEHWEESNILDSCSYMVVEPHIIDKEGFKWVTSSTVNRHFKKSSNWAWTIAQSKNFTTKQITIEKRKYTLFKADDFEQHLANKEK